MLNIIEPPAPTRRSTDYPVWLALGFRPFYLLAAGFAALAVPLWLLQRHSMLAYPGYLSGVLWHQHEMIFGFASAVIVGFLFTAGRVWTNLPTPVGRPLLGFALLWLAARLALPLAPAWLGVPLDLALLPGAAWVLLLLVWRSRTWRHLPIVAALAGLAICNIFFHLALLHVLELNPLTAIHAALAVIVMLVQTMAGRVIPGFTANALPHATIRRYRWHNRLSHLMLGIALASVVAGVSPPLTAALCCIAALLHFGYLWCWDSLATLQKPILWVLHLAYAWLPTGMLLMAAAEMGRMPLSLAWHALAVGTMSGMISGMITRTALGHTGRPLMAGKAEIAFYILVQLAALARVVPGIFRPDMYDTALAVSATLWAAAFVTYCIAYLPILTRPRVDGRPG